MARELISNFFLIYIKEVKVNKDLNKISNLNKNFGCEFNYKTNI